MWPKTIFFLLLFCMVKRTVGNRQMILTFGALGLCAFSARHLCQKKILNFLNFHWESRNLSRTPVQSAINKDQAYWSLAANISEVGKSKTNYAPAKSKSHKKRFVSYLCYSFIRIQSDYCLWNWQTHTQTRGKRGYQHFWLFASFFCALLSLYYYRFFLVCCNIITCDTVNEWKTRHCK